MTSRKRLRRQEVAAEEYYVSRQEVVDDAVYASKHDEELFMIDKMGSKSSKRRIEKQILNRSNGNPLSKTEKKLIGKILSKEKKIEHTAIKPSHEQYCDLWNQDVYVGTEEKAHKPKTRSKVLKVAGPGQSYNPSIEDHQNIIAEALALEIKKQEIDAKTKGPLDTNLSVFTQSIMILQDDDEEGSAYEMDEVNDNEDIAVIQSARKIKWRQKLTRTERNKIRNRKAMAFDKSIRDQQKELLNSITNIPKILKEIRSDEQQNELNNLLRQQQQHRELCMEKGMSYEEAGAIPLTDELDGSLRTLIPKGLPLQDQIIRMRNTGDLMRTDRRSRKVRDVPHKGKRVKWVAKYKYV